MCSSDGGISQVRACRAESRGGQPSVRASTVNEESQQQATTYRPLEMTNVAALAGALVSDPAATIMNIGRHMPVRDAHSTAFE